MDSPEHEYLIALAGDGLDDGLADVLGQVVHGRG